jgi:hypothetical protein
VKMVSKISPNNGDGYLIKNAPRKCCYDSAGKEINEHLRMWAQKGSVSNFEMGPKARLLRLTPCNDDYSWRWLGFAFIALAKIR